VLNYANFWRRYDHCVQNSGAEFVLLPLAAQFEWIIVELLYGWTGRGMWRSKNCGRGGEIGENFSRSLLGANLAIYLAERNIAIQK